MGLKDVGAAISAATDMVYEDYIDIVKSGDLSTGDIDTLINAGLTSYADKTYVDTKDGLNATKAYVDAGDAARVRTSTKDIVNGVPGLDTTGKVLPARINVATTQTYFRGPWSPSSYNGAQVDATTETTIYTVPVTDPGYPYKLIVLGTVNGFSSLATEFPQILVRTGSTSGEIIARGNGLQNSYYNPARYSDNFNGSALDTTKWAVLGARPLITWTAGGGNGYILPGGNRQSGVWIGNQPNTDKLKMSFTARNLPIAGSCRVVMHGNAGWTQWVALEIQTAGTSFNLVTGTTPDWLGGNSRQTNSTSIDEGDVLSLEYDPVANKYQMRQNGTARGAGWVDSSNVITHGVGNRNFGILTNSSGDNSFRGTGIDDFFVEEYETNPGYSPIHLAPVSAQTAKTGSTTLYVRMQRSGAAATVSADTWKPNIHVMAVAA